MAVRLSPVPVLCRTRLAACLLVLLTLFPTGCRASPQAMPSPAFFPESAQGSGTITLSLEDGTIWLLVGDESPRFLAHGGFPKLSPDGCSAVFIRDSANPPYFFEYWAIDVGKPTSSFLFSPYDVWKGLVYSLAWSPDSESLALTTGGDIKKLHRGDLWLVDASDGPMTQLAEEGAGEPRFSPDGKWIATTTPEMGWTHGSVGLWSIESEDGGTVFGPLWRHALEWARDSSGFAAAINYDGGLGMDLWWVPVDGDPVQLGHLPDAMRVLWQPGAEWMAYSSAYSNYGIRLLRRDGSGEGIVPGSEDMNPSSWSPDGRWLLTQGQDGHTYIVDIQAMHAPLPLDVGRVHGWLDARHYIASTERADHTELYRCVAPQTCQSLARFPGPISRLSLTGERCPDVCWEAIGDPGPFDLEEDVPALIEALLAHPEIRVRGDAAYRLGQVGPQEGVVPALIQAMEDDPHMRWAVAEALQRIGPAAVEAVPALIRALEDECAAEPGQACYVERHAIARALRAITGQDFAEDTSAWRAWWKERR
jgi:WD40 repeat protein